MAVYVLCIPPEEVMAAETAQLSSRFKELSFIYQLLLGRSDRPLG